jgi:hypothetical protein
VTGAEEEALLSRETHQKLYNDNNTSGTLSFLTYPEAIDDKKKTK